jgi:hypothetical protein
MQTNITVEKAANNAKVASRDRSLQKRGHLPFILLIGMVGAILFLDAVLPLGGLWFETALLPQLGAWTLLPTHLLFPGWAVSSLITSDQRTAPSVVLGSEQVPFLLLAFLLIFILYLVALRYLPRYLTNCRYIIYSTLVLGFIYILIPVVTSPDVFSYMSYARMGVIYHLNPLTTLPIDIRNDPTYMHIYWNTQPSAYGPTWVGISCLLQWLVLPFGAQRLLPLLMALRLFGLVAHLSSTLLIWSISGHIQRQLGQRDMQKRILATFAFAWNPLLLLEACVNAHNDVALLLLILLAIWCLVSQEQLTRRSSIMAVAVFALATCLKLNAVVLMPFVLIFLWKWGMGRLDNNRGEQGSGRLRSGRPRGSPLHVEDMNSVDNATPTLGSGQRWSGRPRALVVALVLLAVLPLIYNGLIVLLYAPFWQHGAILNIFHANPTTSRNINTPMEFLFRLYNAVVARFGQQHPPVDGSHAENVTHVLSIGLFMVLYGWLCWRVLRTAEMLHTNASLISWLALAWFLYCALGTPWFWPWYLVTFFGLYAIVAATSSTRIALFGFTITPLTFSLLALSMLSIYCFYAWNFDATFVRGLPDFRWSYLRGLWVWGIPLLGIRRVAHTKSQPPVLSKETAE